MDIGERFQYRAENQPHHRHRKPARAGYDVERATVDELHDNEWLAFVADVEVDDLYQIWM